MNDLLQAELSVFLGYEPYGKVGYNSGNSRKSMENTDNLLTFYQFPYQIWHSIYSTNLIESLNKEIKRQTKKKVLFPNEEAMERYLVSMFEDYNFKQSQRIHKGFGQCSDPLESLFD